MTLLKLYQMKLADLEYKEGLGAVHAPYLRRCIKVLQSKPQILYVINNRIESKSSTVVSAPSV